MTTSTQNGLASRGQSRNPVGAVVDPEEFLTFAFQS
jgi:hypothetical protein